MAAWDTDVERRLTVRLCSPEVFFFFSSRRRHTRCYRDWSSDVCSSPVGSVHASDRHQDLALVKGATMGKTLSPLELDVASTLTQGQPIVVMGNPLGLKHSVVSGIVSAVREVEGQE